MAYPERIVPDETSRGIVAIHEKRYRFALPYCEGKDVLDAACGVGYGSALLATVARSVLGADVSDEAIEYARRRYAAANVRFERMDLLVPDLADDSFDVVCAFETIEHLPDRDRYLAHVARILRPAGIYLVSTPRAEQTIERPQNPYHHVEYAVEDFAALLGRYFAEVELYGQRRLQTARHRLLQRLDVLGLRRRVPALRRASRAVAGTPPMEDMSADEIVIEREGLERATELVAVCRAPKQP